LIAIVAVDENWAIGYRNDLLARIPEDQKFFRETTTGGVIVMGRNTLESFPGGKPLKGRTNIVLSRNMSYVKEGATVVHNGVELKEELKKYTAQEVFIIGGEHVYRAFLDDCESALVTKIDSTYVADVYFPNLDVDKTWELESESPVHTFGDLRYRFCQYRNTAFSDSSC